MEFSFLDQETFLLQPGMQAPPIVCLQFAVGDDAPQLVHQRDPAFRRQWEWLLANTVCSLHNASFDLVCLMADDPDHWIPQIRAAYAGDRVTCTIVRQKLLDIAKGDRKALAGKNRLSYDLGSVARRLGTGIELNKEDPWRLRYGTLWGVDVAQWSTDAVKYALDDCLAQRAVTLAQEVEAVGRGQPVLQDQFRQSRKDLWLRSLSAWGFATDPEQVARHAAEVVRTLQEDTAIAKAAGLVRADGTRDLAAAMARMVHCCETTEELDLPLTVKGHEIAEAEGLTSWQVWAKHRKYIELSDDAITLYGDETLEAYQRYTTAKTRLARVERLRYSPIQASFDSLVDTGRTSCRQGDTKPGQAPTAHGAQLQNPSKIPGYRECWVPRKGYALVSIDYNALELRTWSQVCIWTVGESLMAEVLNTPGRCPHTEFAARLAGDSPETGYARRKAGDKEFERNYRDPAKNCNFGFLGGMGARKFVITVRKGGGGEIELDTAKRYRQLWLEQWRARRYFDYISNLFEGQDLERIQIEQFKSGRFRGKCYYTQACNTLFQGLAADITSDAGWRIWTECYDDRRSPLYGSRTVNFPHDEFILEIPLDRVHDAAYRATQLMLDAAHDWCPDLRFTAEPAAMDRWAKSARTLHDAAGRLQVDHIELAS